MTYEQILDQAAKNKGLKFNEKMFRVAFDQKITGSTKLLNRLIKDGIIEKTSPGNYIIKIKYK